ncbi:cupin domain-containing protein [Nocardioides bruguierae]|uniref:cupin domain-containing protein n=1 Tax=Nocardioides bruguierae TaxID=2945102 RepID=UPI0020225EB9|nr:hypothetical protein [Nocardioides bruguierae]MCL8024616.1 hypothetical protein [Nocardioides bruguierae]
MTTEATTEASTGTTPFRVTTDAWKGLPFMEEHPDNKGYIGDVYENPEGSRMCSGYFELHHTDEPLVYDYGYDEMKIVVEGEFLLRNVDTGQEMVAKARDAIFFPKGSRIAFSTPSYALAFYVGDRDSTLL